MLGFLKAQVRRWLDVPDGGSVSDLDTKAPRSATLTDGFGGGGAGGLFSRWNDGDTSAYNRDWVFASVRVIAQKVAAQPVRVGRVADKPTPTGRKAAAASPPWLRPGMVTETAAHPLLQSLADPNPFLTQWALLYLTVASLQLTGAGYWWLDAEGDSDTRIWYVPSGWVRDDPDAPIPLTRFIVRPAASTAEFRLDSTELVRFALPDPANPWQTLGPLQAGLAGVRADRELQTAQLAAFRNGIHGTTAVIVGGHPESGGLAAKESPILTRQQRGVLQNLLAQRLAGSEKTGLPIILDGYLKDIKRISSTPVEMDFAGSAGLTKERVTQLFGVNPIVLGQVEGANRASSVVADEHLCFSTCGPLCVLLGQTLTKWLRGHYSDPALVAWVDPPRPRDPDGRRADLDQLTRAGAITVNELRAEHGFDAVDGGDTLVRLPASVPPGPTDRPSPRQTFDDPETPRDKGALLVPEPGWAKGTVLWTQLTDAERMAVFLRVKGAEKVLKGG